MTIPLNIVNLNMKAVHTTIQERKTKSELNGQSVRKKILRGESKGEGIINRYQKGYKRQNFSSILRKQTSHDAMTEFPSHHSQFEGTVSSISPLLGKSQRMGKGKGSPLHALFGYARLGWRIVQGTSSSKSYTQCRYGLY